MEKLWIARFLQAFHKPYNLIETALAFFAGAVSFLLYNRGMATTIYETGQITLINGTELEITPLKIKYFREFSKEFQGIQKSVTDDETIAILVKCTRILMKQYCPEIKTIEDVEDNLDLPTIYSLLEVSTGIKIKEDSDRSITDQASDGSTWDELDLAKLESEVFLLGIWKDYDELERSLSMPELTAVLESKRDADYQHKKFLAALKGIDLDKESGKTEENAWEKMKAKVFSGGKTTNPNDITALQGYNAQKAGFGIGMGLSYEKIN
jgi:hypothetical protein